MDEKWSPPKWMYRETTLKKDFEFFENLTYCIFQISTGKLLKINGQIS